MKAFWNYFLPIVIIGLINAQRSQAQNLGECETPDNQRGQCILITECQPLYDILKRPGLSSTQREFLRKSQCGSRGTDILVCCPSRTGPRISPPGRNPVSTGGNILPAPGVCGTGNVEKIFGGVKTKIDEYPWMAMLNYDKPGGRKGFHCGGVLINSRYVLTASHCINGEGIPKDWQLTSVRLGEWDTSKSRDCDEHDPTDCSDDPINVNIEESITHENYNPSARNQLNDIALLRLSRSIPYTAWIKPICLPQNVRSASFEGVSLDVVGWGKTERTSRSDVKLKARVDGVSLGTCNNVYRRQGVQLQNTQICAGGERGIDSCQGDSGGPLISLDRSNPSKPFYFVAGIVSFGPNPCAEEGWPGVYTKVGSYIDWIKRTMKP